MLQSGTSFLKRSHSYVRTLSTDNKLPHKLQSKAKIEEANYIKNKELLAKNNKKMHSPPMLSCHHQ
jgi:hypothetical protein